MFSTHSKLAGGPNNRVIKTQGEPCAQCLVSHWTLLDLFIHSVELLWEDGSVSIWMGAIRQMCAGAASQTDLHCEINLTNH